MYLTAVILPRDALNRTGSIELMTIEEAIALIKEVGIIRVEFIVLLQIAVMLSLGSQDQSTELFDDPANKVN